MDREMTPEEEAAANRVLTDEEIISSLKVARAAKTGDWIRDTYFVYECIGPDLFQWQYGLTFSTEDLLPDGPLRKLEDNG